MPDLFEVSLLVKGREYTENSSSLESSVEILKGYEESYKECLLLAAKRFSTDEISIPAPRIGLISSKIGSLDVKTTLDVIDLTTEIGIAIAPLLPPMISYSLELYKNASALIAKATEYWKSTGGDPITVNITDSPNTVVFVNAGSGVFNVSPDVFAAAKQIHFPLNKMAEQIENRSADSVKIYSRLHDTQEEQTSLLINESNKSFFKLPSKKVFPDEIITIKCGIYQFNKKNGAGKLDVLEEGPRRSIPFEVVNVEHEKLIEALSSIYSVITAMREMHVNALGEEVIKKLHIHSIENCRE